MSAGAELQAVCAIQGLSRLVMEHHWQSDKNGRGLRIVVIVDHHYGPMNYDDVMQSQEEHAWLLLLQ